MINLLKNNNLEKLLHQKNNSNYLNIEMNKSDGNLKKNTI